MLRVMLQKRVKYCLCAMLGSDFSIVHSAGLRPLCELSWINQLGCLIGVSMMGGFLSLKIRCHLKSE